jgi:glutamine amidotransferase
VTLSPPIDRPRPAAVIAAPGRHPRSITIVDYGMGNLRSVAKVVSRLGADVRISSDPTDLRWAERLILPGVGAYPDAMRSLRELNLIEALNEEVLARKKPILGICLGMQLMAKSSSELVHTEGLGWFDAAMVSFDRSKGIRVPHIGWNRVKIRNPVALFDGFDDGSFCYFVHSYHMLCADPSAVVATTTYGEDFVSVIARDNIFGTQFHPEKSQAAGAIVLINFVTGALDQ